MNKRRVISRTDTELKLFNSLSEVYKSAARIKGSMLLSFLKQNCVSKQSNRIQFKMFIKISSDYIIKMNIQATIDMLSQVQESFYFLQN